MTRTLTHLLLTISLMQTSALAQSEGAFSNKPENWPEGYVLFDCQLTTGERERTIQAFFDDLGGDTWDKYLIVATSFEEFQALFLAGHVAKLDPLTSTWSRTYPAMVVDGVTYPEFTETFVFQNNAEGGYVMDSFILGQRYRTCVSTTE